MKAYEIINAICARETEWDYSRSCDGVKAGDPNAEVSKIAVCMFPTVKVLRQAAEWGAKLLVTHEPLYFKHMDEHAEEPVEAEKRAIAEKAGLTVYRYHDHAHREKPDRIIKGVVRAMDPKGSVEIPEKNKARIIPEKPVSPRALARELEKKLDLKHIRIAGAADVPCSRVSVMVGSPRTDLQLEELQCDLCEVLVTGEVCEWQLCEYARDAAELGRKKAVLILGHAGSEREGMKDFAEELARLFPETRVTYFDCGEAYTYTEQILQKGGTDHAVR